MCGIKCFYDPKIRVINRALEICLKIDQYKWYLIQVCKDKSSDQCHHGDMM